MSLTCSNNQSLCSAAVETVQQRFRLDVGVEKRHRATDLRQPEPDAQEIGLVAHEQSNAVSFLQVDAVVENIGEPVAADIDVPVRVAAAIVHHKRLVGNAPRLLNEPVQDCTHAGCHFEELQLHAVPENLRQEEKVLPEVGEAEFLHNQSEDDPGDKR